MAATNGAELPRHTLSIHVANKPGVLMRVSQAFARRGFNIDSLVVSASQDPRFSRMTVVCRGGAEALDQIIKQVAKIVDVVAARDHSGEDVIAREYALVKVNAPVGKRTEILQIVDHFKAQTLDLSGDSLVIQIAGTTAKLDAALEHLDKYGVIEEVRSGQIVMARGRQET